MFQQVIPTLSIIGIVTFASTTSAGFLDSLEKTIKNSSSDIIESASKELRQIDGLVKNNSSNADSREESDEEHSSTKTPAVNIEKKHQASNNSGLSRSGNNKTDTSYKNSYPFTPYKTSKVAASDKIKAETIKDIEIHMRPRLHVILNSREPELIRNIYCKSFMPPYTKYDWSDDSFFISGYKDDFDQFPQAAVVCKKMGIIK